MKITTQIIDNNQFIKLILNKSELDQINKTHLILKIKNFKLYQNIISHDTLYFKVKSEAEIKELKLFLISLNLIKENEFSDIKYNDVVLDIKDDFKNVENTSEYRYFTHVIENNVLREPKTYQMQGAFLNVTKKRILNFSTPGSGKTMMCNLTYTFLKMTKSVNKMVVICPKNAFNTWCNELYDDLLIDDICLIDKNIKNNDLKKEIFLINYEKIQNEYVLKILEQIVDSNTYIVFDELHRLKNPSGVRSTKFLNLVKDSTYATMLSGSPIPNGLMDLYYPLNILFKGSEISFTKDEFNVLSDLKFKLYPHYFRVCKNQLQIPPPKKERIYYYNVTKFEQDLISDIAKKRFYFLYKYIIIQKLLITPDYLLDVEYYHDNYKVPLIYEADELEYIKQKLSNNKFMRLIEVVEDLVKQDKPIIIWCNYIKTIEKIYDYYKSLNIKIEKIYGNTKTDERSKIINNFNNNKLQILVTNYATMSESVSLHHNCHDAIFFEYSFNLVHYTQAKDRIHRVGVTTYTQYHYILPNKTDNMFSGIDNYILEKLNEKENLMNKFLDTNIFTVEKTNDIMQEVEEEVYGLNKLNNISYNYYQKFKTIENKYILIPINYLKTKLKISDIEINKLIEEINFDYDIEQNILYDGGYDNIKQALLEHSKNHVINLKHIIPNPLDNDFRNLIATYFDILYINQDYLCNISEYDVVEFNIIKEGINTIDLNNHIDFCENYPEIIKLLNDYK